MTKIRRGGYIFITWVGDHPPQHVHIYRNGRLVMKWDLEEQRDHRDVNSQNRAHPGSTAAGRTTVRIASITANNRRRAFEVVCAKGEFIFPYEKAEPRPSRSDPIVELFIDPELGNEGFSYVLASGADGSVLLDWVFDYNEEPGYMRDLLLYSLTVQALKRLEATRLSKREIIRRLGTSPAQFYRLIDPTNYRKSVDKMLSLLQVLGCEVDLVVRERKTAPSSSLGSIRQPVYSTDSLTRISR